MVKENIMEINIDNMVIPDHIAIILDGNGRWAKKRGLPRSCLLYTSYLGKLVELADSYELTFHSVHPLSLIHIW